jgi:predicted nucleic acid-binding protein
MEEYLVDTNAVSHYMSGSLPEIVNICVKIRKGKKIKTPDAIIAATALANGFTLVTDNEKDFEGIPKLKIINPKKL